MKLRRLFYWTIGFALIPFLWALLHQLFRMIPSVWSEGVHKWWLYVAGAVVYLLIEKILTKPMTLYVFGHELTHAISGILSGAKIHSFRATSKGGEVRMSHSNLFVALSPYIVPIYAIAIILVVSLVRIWWKHPFLPPVFQFFLGASLAFHFSMTANAVHKKQPDLKIMGLFLSAIVIAIGNALILGVFCVSLFRKTPTLKEFTVSVGKETFFVWKSGTLMVSNEIKNKFDQSPRKRPMVVAAAI
jgi:hypothetical protein